MMIVPVELHLDKVHKVLPVWLVVCLGCLPSRHVNEEIEFLTKASARAVTP